jgi:dihydrofolate reductase
MRATEPGTLVLIGSSGLARSLLERDLVDEWRLMIDPIVLGSGKRLFGRLGTPTALRLASSIATPPGALLTRYVRTAVAD